MLGENIQQNVANVQLTTATHRNKTVVIHYIEAQHEAIGEVDCKGNLHKTIKQAKKDLWVYKGSLDDVGEAEIS